MTTFLGAMPRNSAESSTSFRISAGVEPCVMPRVMDAFAKLTIIPEAFRAERKSVERLEIDIHVVGLDANQADHLASRLRTIIHVDSVLVSLA